MFVPGTPIFPQQSWGQFPCHKQGLLPLVSPPFCPRFIDIVIDALSVRIGFLDPIFGLGYIGRMVKIVPGAMAPA
jgi:hypothetical protein